MNVCIRVCVNVSVFVILLLSSVIFYVIAELSSFTSSVIFNLCPLLFGSKQTCDLKISCRLNLFMLSAM